MNSDDTPTIDSILDTLKAMPPIGAPRRELLQLDEDTLLVYTPPRDELSIGLDMKFTTPSRPDANSFDVQPSPLRFITNTGPYGRDEAALRTDGWRWQAPKYDGPIVVDCETPMQIGRSPFIRVTPTYAHPTIGAWRIDDDNGTAVQVPELRVDQARNVLDTHGRDARPHRAKLQPLPRTLLSGWTRADGGKLRNARVDSGRYVDRLPTSRKRKRERCKTRRRERFAGRALQDC